MYINSNSQSMLIEKLFFEYTGDGKHELFEEIFADDVTVHMPQSWKNLHKIDSVHSDELHQIDKIYQKAFEITQIDIKEIVTNPGKSTVYWSFDGIHRNDFFNISASNNSFSVSGLSAYFFNDDQQIDTIYQSWDMYGLLTQIDSNGIFPFFHTEFSEKRVEKFQSLSARERDCIRHLLQGKTAKETALVLDISYRTVEYYFENIKRKLGCINKRDLHSLLKYFN